MLIYGHQSIYDPVYQFYLLSCDSRVCYIMYPPGSTGIPRSNIELCECQVHNNSTVIRAQNTIVEPIP